MTFCNSDLRPSFKIGTNDKSDQIFLELSRDLNYVIHVYDPHFYLGFFNPSIPMIREMIKPDDTVGNYHNLILTEVGYGFQKKYFLKVVGLILIQAISSSWDVVIAKPEQYSLQ